LKNILVAEDEEKLAEFYVKFLTKNGYNVEVVRNANETLERLHKGDKKFDLLITDMNMPEWDGACSVIGAGVIDKDLKIIIVSGYLHNPDYEFVMNVASNISAVIPKPFDPDVLLQEIKKII